MKNIIIFIAYSYWNKAVPLNFTATLSCWNSPITAQSFPEIIPCLATLVFVCLLIFVAQTCERGSSNFDTEFRRFGELRLRTELSGWLNSPHLKDFNVRGFKIWLLLYVCELGKMMLQIFRQFWCFFKILFVNSYKLLIKLSSFFFAVFFLFNDKLVLKMLLY